MSSILPTLGRDVSIDIGSIQTRLMGGTRGTVISEPSIIATDTKQEKVVARLTNEKQLIVLKNNVPAAVILSPEEYIRLSEMAEDHYLALEAQNRMAKSSETVSFDDVMKNAGITQADLDDAEEPDIE